MFGLGAAAGLSRNAATTVGQGNRRARDLSRDRLLVPSIRAAWSLGAPMLAMFAMLAGGCHAPASRGLSRTTEPARQIMPTASAQYVPTVESPSLLGTPRTEETALVALPAIDRMGDGRDGCRDAHEDRSEADSRTVTPVAHEGAMAARSVELERSGVDDVFAGQAELSLESLIDEVVNRNQSLQAMLAAWRAAAQRYPQAVSLDDPMLMSLLGPASFGKSNVNDSWMIDASQKLPWPGKRQLRGRVARAGTAAAYQEVGGLQLQLAEAATVAFFDYFEASRELELNAENIRRMREFRDIARAKYESAAVTQQDVLQADVELAELARRDVELVRMQRVAMARINTLLHREPDVPLPDAPRKVGEPRGLPEASLLHAAAIAQRPDLAALRARIRAEQVAVELACKEFYPDVGLIGRYDQFWEQPAQRAQVGMNMNVPLYRDRRRAAVREATYRVAQRRAEYEQRIDDTRNEVQSGYERVNESRQVVELYRQRIVPASGQNVASAETGYTAGRVDFLRLVEAQRQLIKLREDQYQAIADYHRRLAELQRAVGGPLPDAQTAEEVAPR